ncbi:hypothetical protein ENBRE01_2924 [Enteropsectra breve]|nr:hypothetical protein ENBRE01_2924 [Enteropsectra breve]
MNNSFYLNTSANCDMASTKVPSVHPFIGASSEDATTWITNCKFLSTLYELDDKAAIKVIFSSLKGTAFDWARETLTQSPDTSASELLMQLSRRFLSRLQITETAQRFLSDQFPETSEFFF